MPSYYDGVLTISSIAAVGIVFGFLGGVAADTEALSVPIAASTFLLTGAVFLRRFRHFRRGSSRPQATPAL